MAYTKYEDLIPEDQRLVRAMDAKIRASDAKYGAFGMYSMLKFAVDNAILHYGPGHRWDLTNFRMHLDDNWLKVKSVNWGGGRHKLTRKSLEVLRCELLWRPFDTRAQTMECFYRGLDLKVPELDSHGQVVRAVTHAATPQAKASGVSKPSSRGGSRDERSKTNDASTRASDEFKGKRPREETGKDGATKRARTVEQETKQEVPDTGIHSNTQDGSRNDIAAIAALNRQINKMRDNEEHLLQCGLAWKKERDELQKRVAELEAKSLRHRA
ncbi:hypothetical protein G7046_g9143 [Stylonectria norvegica]|nr:hypothetical protein G7046_g9143 [Stylonectria norvegica]